MLKSVAITEITMAMSATLSILSLICDLGENGVIIAFFASAFCANFKRAISWYLPLAMKAWARLDEFGDVHYCSQVFFVLSFLALQLSIISDAIFAAFASG